MRVNDNDFTPAAFVRIISPYPFALAFFRPLPAMGAAPGGPGFYTT